MKIQNMLGYIEKVSQYSKRRENRSELRIRSEKSFKHFHSKHGSKKTMEERHHSSEDKLFLFSNSIPIEILINIGWNIDIFRYKIF
jgi:hypothetical protein